MSFPSVHRLLELKKLNPESADEHALIHVLLDAFRIDLAEGFSALGRAAEQLRSIDEPRLLLELRRESPVGRHVCRLVGTDAARPACEHAFGVSLALYYPCVVVLAKEPAALDISTAEQQDILTRQGLLELGRSRDAEDRLARWFEERYAAGVTHVRRLASDAREQGIRIRRHLDPKSADGVEVAALLGTHVARALLAERLGVDLGFLNCCGPAAQEKRKTSGGDDVVQKTLQKRGDRRRGEDEGLVLTLREQIAMQATADC